MPARTATLRAAAIEKMESPKDALPALLPIGLGQRGGEFDKVFLDTFQLVVIRGQKPRAVLDREAETLNRLMTETGAPCWQPDPPSPARARCSSGRRALSAQVEV
jgi:multiple sugar transport system substrate-binding protein